MKKGKEEVRKEEKKASKGGTVEVRVTGGERLRGERRRGSK